MKTLIALAAFLTVFKIGTPSTDAGLHVLVNGNTGVYWGAYSDDFQYDVALSAGVWYHFCGTYDGATAIIYHNGVASASASKPAWNTGNSAIILGAFQVTSQMYFYGGGIDELRIHKRVLSAQEVRQLYLADKP